MKSARNGLFFFILFFVSAFAYAKLPAGCELTHQKTVGSGDPFSMFVYGDSVVWSDGMSETKDDSPGHKYSALVAQWIATNLHVQVTRTVFAHSAALVHASPSKPDSGKRWPGYVNANYEVIAKQVNCPAEAERQAARLVLINGCINDVGAYQIVNPQNSLDWVKSQTDTECDAPIYSLLSATAKLYPSATVVITGYYQIVSEMSNVEKFLEFLQRFLPHEAEKMAWMNGESRLTQGKTARDTSAANCKLFYDESNKLIGQAVDRVNSEIGTARVYFVKIPFGPENAFGAHDSYLWPIPNPITGVDEEYWKRQVPCFNAFKGDFSGFETCALDPTAHPNVKGAAVFAREIEKVLQRPLNVPAPR